MPESEDLYSDYARDKAKTPAELSDDDLEVEVEEEDPTFEVADDGSVTTFEGEDEEEPIEFDGNLAELMSKDERVALGRNFLDKIEQDKKDREPHDKKYAEGIRRSGLGDDAPGGASFEGASVVVHPILTECAVDFQASAMKELFPPQGPVKTQIIGKVTPDKREKAERKRDHMNWQLTTEIEEYPIEMENLLMQLPFSGAQYLHIYHDLPLGRHVAELLTSDLVYVPFGTANFYMASRCAVRCTYTEDEIDEMIEFGEWVDMFAPSKSTLPERTKTQEASDKVEGVDEPAMNEDGLKVFYRVYAWTNVDVDDITEGARAPYILMIDEDTGEVVSIRRNWDEADPRMKKLDWVVEFKFFPWKGPYGIGFTHMIGGLSAAMTGSLRALLDTAHINNFPALLKLKSKTGGSTISLEATGITEIEGTSPVDDIRKLVMSVPFNPPSEALFKLLGWLEGVAKGVVTTAEEKIADATNNGPVGTTLALIEQGSKVYANIHSRLHRSQKKALSIIHRLNKTYLDDKIVIEELGDLVVHQSDYEGAMDVIPVSDPNIFSESQRYAQLQAVRQLRTQEPDLFNRKALVRRELQQLRVDNYEELLIPDPEVKRANPVAENVSMAMGRAAAAFPDQDHLAHLRVHIAFIQDINFGQSPLIAPTFMNLAIQHIKEHLVLWYGTYMFSVMTKFVGPQFEQYLQIDAVSQKIDQILAIICDEAHQKMGETLKGLPPVIDQAIKIVQQYAPPPQDPLMAEVKRKEKQDQIEAQFKSEKLKLDNRRQGANEQLNEDRTEIAAAEIEQKQEAAEINAATKVLTNVQDNQTALEIAGAEIKAGRETSMKTGDGINP